MTHNHVYYYGGCYPVQTRLVSPKQASTSTDLRDESSDGTSMDLRNLNDSETYKMASYHQNRLQNCNEFQEEPAPNNPSPCMDNNKRVKLTHMPRDSNGSYETSTQSSLSRSDDSDMEFEIYHTSLVKNAFAPCPLQVPLEDNCFCPRATSTPTMSPENPKSLSNQPIRTTTQRKPAKRKLQFSSEDDEAVYYLQAKYFNNHEN